MGEPQKTQEFGFEVTCGKPEWRKVQRKPPRPIRRIHSRALIRQEDSLGHGLFFQDRKIAFEDATQRWLALYETKELKLMSSGKHYMETFNKKLLNVKPNEDESDEEDFILPRNNFYKKATYILELSEPIHQHGRMSLESILYSAQKTAQRGRFLLVPPVSPKQLFDTQYVEEEHRKFPLLRQRSTEIGTTLDFRVSCRPIQSKKIDMVFIVHHKSIRLKLPPNIDPETYWKIIHMPNVLLFKQMKS